MNNEDKKIRYTRMIILIVVGTIVNLLGAKVVEFFHLPMFLDTIGTILASVIGGGLPGIFTGFTTNLVTGVTGGTSFYFCLTNVLIAAVAALFKRKGYLKKLQGIIVCYILLVFVGGVLGSIISYFVYECYNDPNAQTILLNRNIADNFFVVNILDGVVVDLIDKAITLAIVFAVVQLLPKKLKNEMFLEGWSANGLTKEEIKKVFKIHSRKMSVRTKVVLIVTGLSLILAVAGCSVSYALYKDSLIEKHEVIADSVVAMASASLDFEKIDEYMKNGKSDPEYAKIQGQFESMIKNTKNLEYLYVYKIEEDGCHVVFDAFDGEGGGSQPGDVMPFDESFKEYIPSLLKGEEIEPIISNDSFGWLLTVYKPVYDNNNKCVCYVAADVKMESLVNNEITYLVKMISLFIAFTILVVSLALWIANRGLIYPINAISVSTAAFAFDSDEERKENIVRLENINIKTGDEIEHLYRSIVDMTKESAGYVDEMKRQNNVIADMQRGIILVLADIVESRDQCTGDHVRKTAAYTKVIMDGLLKMHVYVDEITDKFQYDVYHSAPLHDVGKIHIPDGILNKPGKLTDEEYEIMKTHTTEGKILIEQAMENVSGAGYLAEAKILAAYHHEKWDGSGYPEGLRGEAIPLSARIMAVADVFDALVSERSYKKPFTFEKAVEIIKDGSGSHFDPNIVNAFVSNLDEVRKIADSFNRKPI